MSFSGILLMLLAGIGWALLALAVLVVVVLLLLCVPIWVRASVRSACEPCVRVGALCFSVDLIRLAHKFAEGEDAPPDVSGEAHTPKKVKKPKKPKVPDETTLEERIEQVIGLIGTGKENILLVLRHLHIRMLRLDIMVATGDAATTAIRYGQLHAALYTAYAVLCTRARMAEPQICIHPNFLAEEGEIFFETHLSMRPIWLVVAGLRFGWSFLRTCIRTGKTPRPKKHAAVPDEQNPAHA